MKIIKQSIIAAAAKEEKIATEKWGKFNSTHEGYAIIKEEIEEAPEEIRLIKIAEEKAWARVKKNCETKSKIKQIRTHAINCAAELVQVIAVCDKYQNSIDEKEN